MSKETSDNSVNIDWDDYDWNRYNSYHHGWVADLAELAEGEIARFGNYGPARERVRAILAMAHAQREALWQATRQLWPTAPDLQAVFELLCSLRWFRPELADPRYGEEIYTSFVPSGKEPPRHGPARVVMIVTYPEVHAEGDEYEWPMGRFTRRGALLWENPKAAPRIRFLDYEEWRKGNPHRTDSVRALLSDALERESSDMPLRDGGICLAAAMLWPGLTHEQVSERLLSGLQWAEFIEVGAEDRWTFVGQRGSVENQNLECVVLVVYKTESSRPEFQLSTYADWYVRQRLPMAAPHSPYMAHQAQVA